MTATAEQVTFAVLAAPLLFAAAGVLVSKSPVYAALNLVAAFFFLAGIYVLLVAHLIAFMQILVYAGAVMVLFLFVIMLISLGDEHMLKERYRSIQLLGVAGALGLAAVLAWAIMDVRAGNEKAFVPADPGAGFGTVKAVGEVLFTQYLLPFEATSLLLLAAIVGAVVVAKERI
ncbi:MAG TPA: NADH-quinone oxidoreductase subunit J [Anaeromyxobacter sp.]|nr:NADH-quinone oxidoreductase subunit J [Anaeromyxobacter sp.]